MIAIIIILIWVIALFACLFNAAGFMTGHDYDYLNRRRTYHGTKALAWGGLLVVMYYMPWHDWGVF